MDWKKTVCDFVIFRGAAVVQLLGTSIEKPRQARAIPKNHDRRVRFRKTTAGTCDSEKPRQARGRYTHIYIYIYTHPADDYSFLCPRIYIHTPPTYTLLVCTSNYLCLQEETTNAYTRNCSRLSETLEDNQILVHFGFRANTSPTLSLEVNHILVHFGLVRN